MSFHSALTAVQNSKEYKEFKKNNKKAILYSAFFILNGEFEAETEQVDYFAEKGNKIMTFYIDKRGIKHRKDELPEKKKDAIKEIDTKVKDMDFLIKLLKKEMGCNATKIILILQHYEGKQIWNATCMLESFKILNIHIDSSTGKILMKKENNIFDFMQVKKKGEF